MKYLILIFSALLFQSCVMKTTASEEYCDKYAATRFNSWESCYKTKMGEANFSERFAQGFNAGRK